jgi:hypothetical protein
MDGARDLDRLAEWTRAELGIEASTDELESVVNTLAELGYLESNGAAASSADQEAVPTEISSEPTDLEGDSYTDEAAGPSVEIEAPPPLVARPVDRRSHRGHRARPARPRRGRRGRDHAGRGRGSRRPRRVGCCDGGAGQRGRDLVRRAARRGGRVSAGARRAGAGGALPGARRVAFRRRGRSHHGAAGDADE